jgi:hypothetical protein
MVPVEAMASGRPVIAYGRGGATETVAGGVSGVFFGEQSQGDLIGGQAFGRPRHRSSQYCGTCKPVRPRAVHSKNHIDGLLAARQARRADSGSAKAPLRRPASEYR